MSAQILGIVVVALIIVGAVVGVTFYLLELEKEGLYTLYPIGKLYKRNEGENGLQGGKEG